MVRMVKANLAVWIEFPDKNQIKQVKMGEKTIVEKYYDIILFL